MPKVFPLDDFLALFSEFADSKYPRAKVQGFGLRAMMHITPKVEGMPLKDESRQYALFLMTGHLIALEDLSGDAEDGNGISGTPFKATIGSVQIESTKPNSFQSDDWNYWLNLTKYGRELLAFLDVQAPCGVFLNGPKDTVRDLL